MKHTALYLCSLVLSAACLSSCYQAYEEDAVESHQNKQVVTFSFDNYEMIQTPLQAVTRASFSDPSVLLVVDEFKGEVAQIIQLTSDATNTDDGYKKVTNVLSDLQLDMNYGQHNVYFVAAAKAYSDFDADAMTVTWTSEKAALNLTWAQKVTLTVSQSGMTEKSVTLPLVVGKVELTCTDEQDPSIARMQISGSDICWTLDLTTMKGRVSESGISYAISYTLSSYSAGRKFGFYSFEPEGASTDSDGNPTIGSVTFAAKKTDGTVIASHALPNVPIRAGYLTQYSGLFYSNTSGFSLSVVDDWTGTIDREY